MPKQRPSPGEGRPEGVIPPPRLSRPRWSAAKLWFYGGIVLGTLLWLGALPLLGDPRISSVVTSLDGEGPPILVARSSFEMLAEVPAEGFPTTSTPGTSPQTKARLEMAETIQTSLALPEVQKALGTELIRTILPAPTVTPGTPEAGQVPSPGPTATGATPGPGQVPSPGPTATGATPGPGQVPSPAPQEPAFSNPERMIPGLPSASLAQVTNPTKNPVQTEIQPVFSADKDQGLCPALRAAIVVQEKGKPPRILASGKLMEIARGTPPPLTMDPGARYSLTFLVAVPSDAGDEYQGVSCTVDFTMQSQGT